MKSFEYYEGEARQKTELDEELHKIAHNRSKSKRKSKEVDWGMVYRKVVVLWLLFTIAVLLGCLLASEPAKSAEVKTEKTSEFGFEEVLSEELMVTQSVSDRTYQKPFEKQWNVPATRYASLEAMKADGVYKEEQSAVFKVTHYCGCEKCCGKWSEGSESIAHGNKGDLLTPFYSVATDPSVVPYGTILHDVEGNEYKAMDTGSVIKGHRIDLFTGDHKQALELGVKEVELFWEEEQECWTNSFVE